MAPNEMDEKICEIRCLMCGEWFPSAIQFGTAEVFFSSTLIDNLQQCPHCGKMTNCNKENMRFVERQSNGRVTYIEGQDTF